MSENDVTEPLKSASHTSYTKLFVASIIIGPFLVIALIWLARQVLPPSDADAFIAPLMAVWGIVASGSGISTLIGGLLRTQGKVSFQKAAAIAQTVAQTALTQEQPKPVPAFSYNVLPGEWKAVTPPTVATPRDFSDVEQIVVDDEEPDSADELQARAVIEQEREATS